jgi:hypothetical protein
MVIWSDNQQVPDDEFLFAVDRHTHFQAVQTSCAPASAVDMPVWQSNSEFAALALWLQCWKS